MYSGPSIFPYLIGDVRFLFMFFKHSFMLVPCLTLQLGPDSRLVTFFIFVQLDCPIRSALVWLHIVVHGNFCMNPGTWEMLH